ncbi:hypothetical protein ACFYT3_06740 [Nocardia amikacinitolerans]|uniref:Succinate dehydrogenase membrane anchor subunit n=1 Tax=Nocardia amikacinitolerans TaxID=756689 RepID=A0A285LR62_9NOCA|nr:hypothetical protein [Nocardia amikacinitolerans]MCP2276651.1 hypothetical protein [Nocardia amikacinitolerans]MCP2294968.1 hypothetical protein [Nocardia amikacinitolerans]SNY87399.1 hypothetical protein SAMN04244553_4343 [Nocardia amikacinitolerans]
MSAAPTATPEQGTGVFSKTRARIAERTLRTDRWWVPPLLTVLGLSAFIIYATVRSFVRTAYWVPDYHYLTPFYSPCLSVSCVPGSSHFGEPFPELPMWIPLGFVVLPFLLGFRLTCYYYRKAYYRSVWFSPPACAVAEPHAKYTGETRLPLIIQNAHRYFFYVALVVSLINTYDAVIAFHGKDGGFGFGLGNIVLLGNVILLWAYTLSCHSCRHIAGGRLKHFSAHPVRYWFWTQVSKLNTRHMALAWTTLGTLVLTDFYVMLVASNTISDLRFIN